MTSINRPAVYIEVPIPVLEYQHTRQPTPAPKGALPLPYGAHRNGTAQRQPINSEPPSLGSPSISDTPTCKPSELVWKSYRKLPWDVRSKYRKLLLDFCQYMEMCDRSFYKTKGMSVSASCKPYPPHQLTAGTGKNDFGIRTFSGALRNRWHPERRVAWLARMYQLAQWYDANRVDGCTLISLTGYQEQSGLSWYDTLDNITESRTKLLKILRKYFASIGEKLDYFWVVEPHTESGSGYPHIHLAVFKIVDNNIRDSNGEGMEDKLRRLYSAEWGTGSHTYGLDFQPMIGQDSIKDLKNYLMKYIAKGYVGTTTWSQGEIIFNAHLYGATHGDRPPKQGEVPDKKGNYTKKYRLIGMSKNLSELLKPDEEDKEDIIWLDVDEYEPEETRTNPITGEEMVIFEEQTRQLYHRQLIPDWLAPDPQSFNWGRPTGSGGPPQPTDKPRELTLRQRLKLERDGYL